MPPERGRVLFDGRDITGCAPDRVTRAGLVRTFQIARGFPRLSVLENLLLYGERQPGERLARRCCAPRGARGARTRCCARARRGRRRGST